MTQEFKDMLYLFSCGALGKTPGINHNIDVLPIYKLSMEQGVWHIVFLSLNEVKDCEYINWGGLDVSKLNLDTIHAALLNQKRLANVHSFIKKLEAEGIKVTVLKGETLAKLYKNPLCRISSDVDLLIDEKFEKRAVEIAEEEGMEVKTRNASSNHAVAKSEKAGIIELHIRLYDEMLEDVWFDNKMANIEETTEIKTEDNTTVSVLGITDGAIFVTLHLIKHFLEKGVGIRQILDTLLYLKSYKNEIDFKRYFNLLKYLKYDKFTAQVIGIGIEYCGFDKEDLPAAKYDKKSVDKILDDAENGGVFGYGNEAGSDFYLEYTKERFNKFKDEDFNSYIKKHKMKNYLKMLFPNRALLKGKYPYVEKSALLVPIAWLHRICNLIFGKKKKPEPASVKLSAVEKRMQMIRDLDMI